MEKEVSIEKKKLDKTMARFIGIIMAIYSLIYIVLLAVNVRPHSYYGSLSYYGYCITPSLYTIYLKILFHYLVALFCLISSIGLIMYKNWGRILSICATGMVTILVFVSWLLDIYKDYKYNSMPEHQGTPGSINGILGFFFLVIPVALPSFFIFKFLIKHKFSPAPK